MKGPCPQCGGPEYVDNRGLKGVIKAEQACAYCPRCGYEGGTIKKGVKQFKSRKTKCGTCKVCGCTDDCACPGGCSWVDREHTLCSSCQS